MKDKPKTFFNVNIVFEMDKDKGEKALEKILKIIYEVLNCSSVRIEPFEHKGYKRVYVKAEFCKVIEQ